MRHAMNHATCRVTPNATRHAMRRVTRHAMQTFRLMAFSLNDYIA